MEREQTAVEYFNDALDEILQLYPSEWMEIQKVFNQAKQMEKEQIVEAWLNGYHKCSCKQPKQGTKYYLETYGKDENKAENND